MKTRQRTTLPAQGWDRNVNPEAVRHSRTLRADMVRTLSSTYAGKLFPVCAVPLLREDGLATSPVRVAFDMSETADMILNAVRVVVRAHFVPKLAFERFNGIDALNRSYNEQEESNGEVIPWFEMMDFEVVPPGPDEPGQIFQAMGLHCEEGKRVNTDYVEAYNAIWNYLAKLRSPSLEARHRLDTTLAPAFWSHTSMRHVKPTFDQAMIDGEVPLRFAQQYAPLHTDYGTNSGPQAIRGVTGEPVPNENVSTSSTGHLTTSVSNIHLLFQNVFADLDQADVTVSLANIEMAKKTAAWARIRATYQGVSEDWMIDQLLSGVRIPEEHMRHPVLMAREETVFGMAQRYSTDSDALDKSATRGMTFVDLNLRFPQQNTSGVIMITAEILPEQFFERTEDSYLVCDNPNKLPERILDELDPEPVTIVRNGYVDAAHSDPDGLFGYAPLNHEWMRQSPRIGGRFYRDDPQAGWTEDRNRIWAVEKVDPALGEDFYLATDIHHRVFADSSKDPFEVNCQGIFNITGLTYFGPALREATDDYQSIMDRIDDTRLPAPGSVEDEEDEELVDE